MNETIINRLAQMRALMSEGGVQAVIVPQADPHQGEYLAPHWQVRRWLSGFTGSAGDLVVTSDKAALWTDSRYFIQAAAQLEGTGIELMKDGLAETLSIAEFLCSELTAGDKAALDGMPFTEASVEALRSRLDAAGIGLVTDFDVIDRIWLDRPAIPVVRPSRRLPISLPMLKKKMPKVFLWLCSTKWHGFSTSAATM